MKNKGSEGAGRNPASDPKYPVPLVASMLSISRATLYRMVGNRAIGSYRINGSIRIAKSHIDRYLTEHETRPAKPTRRNGSLSLADWLEED